MKIFWVHDKIWLKCYSTKGIVEPDYKKDMHIVKSWIKTQYSL